MYRARKNWLNQALRGKRKIFEVKCIKYTRIKFDLLGGLHPDLLNNIQS